VLLALPTWRSTETSTDGADDSAGCCYQPVLLIDGVTFLGASQVLGNGCDDGITRDQLSSVETVFD